MCRGGQCFAARGVVGVVIGSQLTGGASRCVGVHKGRQLSGGVVGVVAREGFVGRIVVDRIIACDRKVLAGGVVGEIDALRLHDCAESCADCLIVTSRFRLS